MNDAIKILFEKMDFTDTDVYTEFIEYVQYHIKELERSVLFDVGRFITNWLELEPEFKQKFPDRAEQLEYLAATCAWLTLPMQKNDVVLNHFKQYIGIPFTIVETLHPQSELDYPVEIFDRQVRAWLLNTSQFDERDTLKKELLKILLNSTYELTKAQFYTDIKESQPTIANWFNAYEAYALKRYNEFTVRRFLSSDENAKRLDEEDKHKLEVLLNLHNRLYISSWSPLGMEESLSVTNEDGTDAVINYGVVEPYTKEQQQAFENAMKNIKTLYKESGIAIPSDIDWLEDGTQKRPPVNMPQKGTLQDPTLQGPDVTTLAGPDHFTEDDAIDIGVHGELVQQLAGTSTNYEDQAKQIIAQLHLTFVTPDIEKKFIQLVVSVLRGLRDTLELSMYLQEQHFSENIISEVVNVLKATMQKKRVITATEPAPTPESAIAGMQAQAVASSVDMPNTASVTTQAQTMPSGTTPTKRGVFLPKLRRSRNTKKPVIDDVKLQQSMVMGPVDELHAMDTIEFRRLADNPVAAAQKIKSKIDLLAEESVSKQAEGINAWRNSPINTLYVEIGNQSMMQAKSVNDIMAERQQQNLPVLSEAEFNAIADLNRQLRF